MHGAVVVLQAMRTTREHREGCQLPRGGWAADERGASLVEYLILVGAVAIVCLAGVRAFGDAVSTKITCMAARFGGGASCAPADTDPLAADAVPSASSTSAGASGPSRAQVTAADADPPGPGNPLDGAMLVATKTVPAHATEGDGNPDRRDTERDARDDRRTRGRGDETQPKDGTDGPDTPPEALGEPVAGTSVPEPKPPAWKPADEGAGEHDSNWAMPTDYAVEFAAEAGANAMAGAWPDASRNLLHFLGNSGEPLEQDVNKMLGDIPEFKQQIEQDQADLGQTAIDEAKRRGATGPITFPVNTAWTGYGYDENGLVYENKNWFYALGGWQYNLTGQVTVYPPSKPGEPWRYETATTVNIRDQYNWDGSKATNIGPLTVSDEELAELHRSGLAQEYEAYGASDTQRTSGSEQ
jgi:Flp pilus assembly pilin Flp